METCAETDAGEHWHSVRYASRWSIAAVTCIYKKGDPADCDNYRPISLLCIAEKIIAAILKQRILDAGADADLWPSQFGFRAGRGTEDAIYIARRRIELARARRNGKITLLALDWAKAFDSISPSALLHALHRFGLPQHFIELINAIYSSRQFFVHDQQHSSSTRLQHVGISQGCPLSPMLFVRMMSVLIHDARQELVSILHDDA